MILYTPGSQFSALSPIGDVGETDGDKGQGMLKLEQSPVLSPIGDVGETDGDKGQGMLKLEQNPGLGAGLQHGHGSRVS